ncbi:hypothetical protein Daura_09975 [Dactylosporangium aurantiacum]|uniref:Protein kinase domain-containing protein n=1 Tax=Dactylosporangium aurantiacum TaxID=35754 RepID=A0A9Q9MES7_9ACTN|nr:hypothetical protein [Dactylosporangium aurantiacum]MDG6109362.1 hypothetical protein [Dactylosporangium aurantiacum]UWZ56468.1 hypothetical protein Daura_09975 [Dactylosporangium aurantiacum]
MGYARDDDFIIDINATSWYAKLAVEPPDGTAWEEVLFDVTAPGALPGQGLRVRAEVLYTTAVNHAEETEHLRAWHVKVYRCAHKGDADVLRRHLDQQARALQAANDRVADIRRQIDLPWALVPVEIRGVETSTVSRRTRLGAPAGEVVDELRGTLPAWFGQGVPRPECFVLAVSPTVEPAEWRLPSAKSAKRPATQHLRAFEKLAAGLDALHAIGWAHCDIKPEHVCRYQFENTEHFALIDSDSATALDSAPTTLRTSGHYDYGPVRRWRRRTHLPDNGGLDAGYLRAQDRFGFALMVLAALAGVDWVDRSLLGGAGNDFAARAVDNRDDVRDALSRYLGRQWAPLVAVLAEPFGVSRDLAGHQPMEDAGKWAGPWLARLLEATEESRQIIAPEVVPVDEELLRRHEPSVARILRATAGVRAPRPDKPVVAINFIRSEALAVAVRAALWRMAVWTGGIVTLGAVFIVSALGWGK